MSTGKGLMLIAETLAVVAVAVQFLLPNQIPIALKIPAEGEEKALALQKLTSELSVTRPK